MTSNLFTVCEKVRAISLWLYLPAIVVMLLETFQLSHVFINNWLKGTSLGVMRLEVLFIEPSDCINLSSPDYFDSWITEILLEKSLPGTTEERFDGESAVFSPFNST